MQTALNSPFKGYYPNVNPFGISPRYNGNTPLSNLYNKYKMDDSVNYKLSKVKNRRDANAEIEQGEIVRQDLPNGGTLLHKALGKKHKNGGIPVNLPDNSFIFSNYKSTSLNKEELDTFNLGGYSKKINSRTPSKILENNVDIKHYNEMEKYLQESKNPIEKTTARIMKDKYDKIISKIGALQEYKKPNATIPNFAYLLEKTPQLKDEEIQTEMYREGGRVLPKYRDGKAGYRNSPEQRKSIFDTWLQNSSRLFPVDTKDFDTYYNNPSKLQSLYATNPNYDDAVVDMMKREGMTYKGLDSYGDKTDYTKDEYLQGFQDNKFDRRVLDIQKKTFDNPEAFTKLGYKQIDPEGNVYYTGEGNSYVIPEYAQKSEDLELTGDPDFTEDLETTTSTKPTKGENNLDKRFGDDMSWLKGYNWTPKMLSMLGNMAQYPRAYNPSLSLEQPLRVREQLLDAQPSVNDVLANRYMALKASNQYAPQSVANKQFLDTDVNKQINDYRYKIDQANQNISTDVNNKNAQMQNQVVNSNNARRAQYIDKMNELYQNMANERNTINATNLNLLGQGLNEQDQTNLSNELMRRQYNWNVNQMMQSMSTSEQIEAEINRINKLNLDDSIKQIYITNLLKKQYSTNPATTNPYSFK